MKRFQLWALLSAAFASEITASLSLDRLNCTDLARIPTPYSYNGTDLKNFARACLLDGDHNHTVDIFRLIGSDLDSYVNIPTESYTVIDIYLNCTQPAFVDFDTGGRVNMSLITILRSKDCIVTFDALSRLGRTVYLIDATLNYINAAPPVLSREELHTPEYPGLTHMFQLAISINHNITGIFHLPEILPVLQSIRALALICVDEFYDPSHCPSNRSQQNIKLDLNWLKNSFSRLQSLHLSSVDIAIELGEKFAFPWTNETFHLPLGLSRSSFQQRQYTNGIKTLTTDNILRKAFYLGNIPHVTMNTLCPFAGPVDKVVISRQFNLSFPESCFTATPNITAIDIVDNRKLSLPLKLFHGLSQLRSLNFYKNNIQAVQVGLFDDLTNLELLNLDANKLSNLSSGIFTNLRSLEVLLVHENHLTFVEPGSLPLYSENLRFIDFRRNNLQQFVSDCLKLPKLAICDMDLNHIDLNNLRDLLRHEFNPVQLYYVEPLAYNGEPLGHFEEGVPHEPDQARISLRSNNITTVPVNLAEWSEADMLQMTALIGFFQINLDDNNIQCDCAMYDMKRLINDSRYRQNEAGKPLRIARYRETQLFTSNNLKSWKCNISPLLGLGHHRKQFHKMPDQNFICNVTDTEPYCPKECHCFRSPVNVTNGRILVDCSHRGLTSYPKRMPMPDEKHSDMLISLRENIFTRLPKCLNYNCTGDYEWLSYVTELDLEGNSIQPEDGTGNKSSNMLQFLNSLKKIEKLRLAENSIIALPEEIRLMDFTYLTIARNSLHCNCHNLWMRDWIREKNDSIAFSPFLTCIGGPRAIVQLTDEEFLQNCGPDDVMYELLSLLIIPIVMGLVSFFYFRRELNLIVFEKLGIKFMDRLKGDQSKRYDAVLVYADEDTLWAQETLLKNLEYIYRYYIADYARDSEYGRGRSETNCELLANAQRAIVVMSNKFIVDDECMRMFSEARSYSENKRFLLLIKMEDLNLDPANEAHQIITNFLKTNFYVDIRNTHRCLARLCYWMPIAKRPPPITKNIPNEYLRPRIATSYPSNDEDAVLINNIV